MTQDPIDLHEVTPGQWVADPHYVGKDGHIDFSKVQNGEEELVRAILRRHGRPRPMNQMPLDVAFAIFAIMGISVLCGILKLFGLIR